MANLFLYPGRGRQLKTAGGTSTSIDDGEDTESLSFGDGNSDVTVDVQCEAQATGDVEIRKVSDAGADDLYDTIAVNGSTSASWRNEGPMVGTFFFTNNTGGFINIYLNQRID